MWSFMSRKRFSKQMTISFLNQENEKITKIDWKIDSYKI